MVDDKDIKTQINEYHKLLEDLKTENITLSDAFVAGILIEKLPGSRLQEPTQAQTEATTIG
jgi:hypothetical protein